MPYLPPGQSPFITAAIQNNQLADWLDGRAEIPSSGPHTAYANQFGCTINRDLDFPLLRVHIKKGMQGHLIQTQEKNGEKRSKIFIKGVTESPLKDEKTQQVTWINNIWVPYDAVDKGSPWKPDVTDWQLNVPQETLSMTNVQLNQVAPPDTSLLGKTIMALLEAFQTQPAVFMGSKFQNLVDRRGLPSICTTIITGIKDAGLYNVLNRTSFTRVEFRNASRHRIDDNYARATSSQGIYVRLHLSNSQVAFWKKNTRYIYIGKTVNFHDRAMVHQDTTTKYGDLTRNSTELDMFAVCILHKNDMPDLAFLVEQIFICLFGSYRDSLFTFQLTPGSSISNDRHISATAHARYFIDIAEHVFQQTGWRTGTSRPGLGITDGANFSSPLQEWAKYVDALLWIRTDTQIKNKNDGSTTPMSTYRLAKPRLLNLGSSRTNAYVYSLEYRSTVVLRLTVSSEETDGSKVPLSGVPYYLVIELRKDGSAHPQAWSRLPDIGPFTNWNQARSFAFRMEWEHPPNSGKWKYRYLQAATGMFRIADTNTPGSFWNYRRAIFFLEWLSGTYLDHGYSWIPHHPSSAYVIQAHYDLHNQIVTIKPPTESFTMLPATKKSLNEIVQELRSPRLKLLNLNANYDSSYGDPRPFVQQGCDLCTLLPQIAWISLGMDKCKKYGTSNMCELCYIFGRPCCTWTRGGFIRHSNVFTPGSMTGTQDDTSNLTAEDVAQWKIVFAALVHQHKLKSSETGQDFRNTLVELDFMAKDEEDPTDVELSNEEEEAVANNSDGDGDA